MTATRTASGNEGKLLPLWIGILGPPVIWAVRIAASYVLVPYACRWDTVVPLHGATAAALLATALIGWVSWDRWRRTGKSTQVELGGPTTRARFMAISGMLSSGFFFLVMVAEGLANFFLDPCQTGGAPLAW